MSELPNAPGPRPAILACCAVLPTVWSNCLAGLWLAQGVPVERWADFFRSLDLMRGLLVLLGTSVVFVGWALRREDEARRRLPGLVLLLAGGLLIGLAGRTPAILAIVLLATVAAALTLPRTSLLAPIFQGLARLAVYLAAAATLSTGINGWAIWGGVVMAAFVAGSGYIVRQQELGQRLEFPPWLLLAAPLVLAWVMNNGPARQPALLLGFVLLLWLARSGQRLFRPRSHEPSRAAVELIPALVLVDWLALADAPRTSGFIFLPLFALALVGQRLTSRTPAPTPTPTQATAAVP